MSVYVSFHSAFSDSKRGAVKTPLRGTNAQSIRSTGCDSKRGSTEAPFSSTKRQPISGAVCSSFAATVCGADRSSVQYYADLPGRAVQ